MFRCAPVSRSKISAPQGMSARCVPLLEGILLCSCRPSPVGSLEHSAEWQDDKRLNDRYVIPAAPANGMGSKVRADRAILAA